VGEGTAIAIGTVIDAIVIETVIDAIATATVTDAAGEMAIATERITNAGVMKANHQTIKQNVSALVKKQKEHPNRVR